MQHATENIIPIYNGTPNITLNKFVIIDKIVEQQVSKSGLLLSASDTKEIRYAKATVVSVGVLVTPDTIKTGDTILYDAVAGFDMMLEGKRYIAIKEGDVIAVI